MSISLADSQLERLVNALFDRWELSPRQRDRLIGAPESRSEVEVRDRAGLLLGIHRALRLLFPANPDLRYSWVLSPNTSFGKQRPLDVMMNEGTRGMLRVKHYLDRQLQ